MNFHDRGVIDAPFAWTRDLVERARALWTEGNSAAAIGRMIGTSKASVSNKMKRMNIPKGEPALPTVPVVAKAPRPVTPVIEVRPKVETRGPRVVRGKGVPFTEAGSDQCRFPLWGETRDMPLSMKRVCGCPTVERGGKMSSWCAEHVIEVYEPPRVRVR